jgi:hypothetical protein
MKGRLSSIEGGSPGVLDGVTFKQEFCGYGQLTLIVFVKVTKKSSK